MSHSPITILKTTCALLLLLTCACERTRPDASPVAASLEQDAGAPPVKTPDVDASPADDSLSAQMARSLGTSCVMDSGCAGYLRCVADVCSTPLAMSGEHDASTPEVIFRDGREPSGSKELSRFHVELATDNAQRQRGLMYRRSMKPDWGMIFIYPQERPLSFWMKNTYISLDMVFINASGEVVGVIEEVEPLTLEPRAIPAPARYVLELGAGVAKKSGITPGVWMDLVKPLEESHRPLP